MNNEKKFIKLTPFKMQVLQSFPFIDADFDAITNYELLCKVVEYLNTTVDNVNLLESDFKILYDYVHDYFDNLDVQEEINNKLDEMAEDGTLQEIMASYLNTKAIFGFDDLESMKNATNLVNGSYVRTLGKNKLNDGYGELYKIRDITNDDIIDNINIIPLNTSNILVAEKINNNIETNKCLISVTKVDNGESYSLALSKSYDGINFGEITILNGISIPYEHHNVAVNVCYTNDKFYILTSIGYWFSDDLINWSEMKTFNVNISAPSIYNGKLYGHYKESNEIINNDVGGTTYPFSIKKYDVIFNDDGTITLSNEITLLNADLQNSHIDPVVIDFNNVTYLACKDEIKCIIKLYQLNNNTLNDTGFTHKGIGIEACKLIPNGDNLYIYADPYGLQTNYENETNVSYDRSLSVRINAINSKGINSDALLTPITLNYEYHPAFVLIDNLNAIRLINSLNYTSIIKKPMQYYKQLVLNSNTSNEIISVINHPLRPLFITGNTQNNNAYLKFTKIFEESPLMIRFDTSSGTTIHPGQRVNGKIDNNSTDVIIKNNEIITAPLYNTSNNTFVFLPTEQYEFRRQLENLPTNQSIQTSLNQKFLKSNTVNFFIISGYGSDITVNLLPTASNFFGEYYKQNNNFGHIKLYRIGDNVIEYQATISNGNLSSWVQTH